MSSDVYFIGLREGYRNNMLDKINKLFNKIKLEEICDKGDLVAIKTHFGELGNTTHLKSSYLIPAVERIKKKEAFPFVTDANTLYNGYRNNGIKHIECAVRNGFSYATLQAPIVIADGIDGSTDVELDINVDKAYSKKAFIGKEIVNAHSIIVYTHFKGHEMFGFGGALKNVGMGCASKKGKLFLHSSVSPFIKEKKCKGCKRCLKFCSHNAISFDENSRKAHIDKSKCVGCGECLMACEYDAISIEWDSNVEICQKKTVEYAKSLVDIKKDKMIYINFIIDISPDCDCASWSDAPIVNDVGIVISKDPLAIDQASYDLVNEQEGNKNSALKSNFEKGQCKFTGVHPKVNPLHQLEHAEKIGIGNRKYNLINIE